ncbi:hypothetical protein N656DRAFT_778893 [Canariomyces notabilis]|uniref:Uncharacterized protein n=1 Tax=Canariomyces notabilis TaxID=2074819 RepID=A0AAN6TDZ5_9PEZI|nr:hypothetical protein N656DRAFT_778893 [Canariomyces arenarius]
MASSSRHARSTVGSVPQGTEESTRSEATSESSESHVSSTTTRTKDTSRIAVTVQSTNGELIAVPLLSTARVQRSSVRSPSSSGKGVVSTHPQQIPSCGRVERTHRSCTRKTALSTCCH